MRDDQLVLDQRVSVQQEGITGVGVNDELIDFAKSKIVLRFHFVKRFSEAPVSKSGRHSIGPERVNNIGRTYFITHRVKIQPKSGRNLRDLGNRPLQRFNLIPGHESIAPSSLLCLLQPIPARPQRFR